MEQVLHHVKTTPPVSMVHSQTCQEIWPASVPKGLLDSSVNKVWQDLFTYSLFYCIASHNEEPLIIVII